jgi:hypothetical protein
MEIFRANTNAAGDFSVAGDLTVTGATTLASDVFVENGGGVVVGASAQETIDDSTSEVQVLGTGDNDSAIAIGRWSANTTSPKLVFYKSRNATIGSNTAVTSGDQLGAIRAVGDDGTDDDTLSSAIIFDTEGTIATGQVPGVIKFKVAAAGSLANAMTIDSTKAVDMAGTLAVTGTSEFTGNVGIGDEGPLTTIVSTSALLSLVSPSGGEIIMKRDDAFIANGNIVGGIAFYANDNQNSTEYNGIQSRANGTAGFTDLCFYSKTGSYASNTPDMKIDKNGAITILSLAGSGSRTVVADANGLITAP